MSAQGRSSGRWEFTADQATEAAKDIAYVGLGLGVLGFQRAQVRRREWNARLGEHLGPRRDEIAGLVSLTEQIDDSLDTVVAKVTDALPAPAAGIVGGLHRLSRGSRDMVRSQVRDIVSHTSR